MTDSERLSSIRGRCFRALTIDRTFKKGDDFVVESEHPKGFMPPDKRKDIIKIIQEIQDIAKEDKDETRK